MNSYKKGLWAEAIAACHFFLRGYRIEKWRYKTPYGEIDLILRKGTQVIFMEVKARRKEAEGLEAVTYRSQLRIRRAAELFQKHEAGAVDNFRFDVVVIRGCAILSHIENAF